MLLFLPSATLALVADCLGWPAALELGNLSRAEGLKEALRLKVQELAKKLGAPVPVRQSARAMLRAVWNTSGLSKLRSLNTAAGRRRQRSFRHACRSAQATGRRSLPGRPLAGTS